MKYGILSCMAFIFFGNLALAQAVSTDVEQKGDKLFKSDVKDYVNEAPYKLPWDYLKEKDVIWKKRVWRVIDAGAADNKRFGTGLKDKTSLLNALVEGTISGKIKAYDPVDDRFTTELSSQQLAALVKSGKGKSSSVSKYLVKEDWLFTVSGQLSVRILGVAPAVDVKAADGTTTTQALFWTYFPSSRDYLAQINASDNQNWDQVLDREIFSSTIQNVKSGHTQGNYIAPLKGN